MYNSYLLLFYVTILSGHCERPKGARQSLFFTLHEIASVVSLPRNDILADCFLPPLGRGLALLNGKQKTARIHFFNWTSIFLFISWKSYLTG